MFQPRLALLELSVAENRFLLLLALHATHDHYGKLHLHILGARSNAIDDSSILVHIAQVTCAVYDL